MDKTKTGISHLLYDTWSHLDKILVFANGLFALLGNLATVKCTISSANWVIKVSLKIGSGMSFTYIRYSIGASDDPWGTPDFGMKEGPGTPSK